MGEDSHEVQTSAPSVTVDRKSGAQLALALTVFALVLTTNAIINESWLTQTSGEELIKTDNFGLLDFNVEQCDGNNCTKQVDSFASAYDNCTKTFEELGFNQNAIDEACSEFNTTHTAGLTATVLLSISAITLLVASVFHVRNMVGLTSKIGNIVSISGGALTVLGILTWYTILPDTESSPEWGQGLWLAIVSGLLAILAGFSGVLQSWIDGPPRMRAKGVRSDTGMSEFVLKESSCGDQALSILVDDSLVRVVRIERRGASPYVKDVLAAKRDSYTGFSHQRLDWLDDFKGVWWVVSGACLVSAVMISNLFLIPFTVGVILVILQLMDPERFVISTSSGNHPFYINRWRSNRELTNLAMDLVDNAMISVLRGDELDTTILDSKAEQISNRFSAMQKKQQQEDKEANERKAALLEAANAQVAAPPQQSPPVLQTPADLPPPPTTTPGQTQESEVEESPQAMRLRNLQRRRQLRKRHPNRKRMSTLKQKKHLKQKLYQHLLQPHKYRLRRLHHHPHKYRLRRLHHHLHNCPRHHRSCHLRRHSCHLHRLSCLRRRHSCLRRRRSCRLHRQLCHHLLGWGCLCRPRHLAQCQRCQSRHKQCRHLQWLSKQLLERTTSLMTRKMTYWEIYLPS